MTEEAPSRTRKFSDQYSFQTQLVQRLVEGVSHEESMLQLPFEANCMNWILGHIISRRQSALETLGAESLWAESQLSHYKTGSDPILSSEQAIRFETLMDDLQRSLSILQSALQDADETLDRIVINDRGEKTAGQHIEGFLWHETYHTGQLEVLRAYIIAERNAQHE